MAYKIIADSCMELTDDMRKSGVFTNVPLQLHIGDETIIDDETFDQISFLEKMNGSPECPKSSCPAPEAFEQTFEGADEIFVVSISSQLSGTYNSAKLAMMDYQDQHPEVKIHLYGKRTARNGRKMGHLTALADTPAAAEQLALARFPESSISRLLPDQSE